MPAAHSLSCYRHSTASAARAGSSELLSSMFMCIQEVRPLSEPLRMQPEKGEGVRGNRTENPVCRLPDWRTTLPLAQSCPRCGARTRSGSPCRQAAMPNGRCLRHGGRSTGPRTAEGIERIRRARTIHGLYSAELLELRRELAEWKRLARHAARAIE